MSPSRQTKILVQKYGGATLADPEKIRAVAQRISDQVKEGFQMIVVVSAMGQTTNSLIELAQQVSSHPSRREMDMLLTVGERISMSLMAMALNDLHCPAISFTGSQAGIFTDDSHVNAFIVDVKAHRVQEALDQGKVVILAGFQGVSPKSKEITTLGRGGSDTSAVAMAAAFRAERCEILKDVPSVFSADPRLVQQARPLEQLNYDQMMDMTFWGAKVLHYRSVELAMRTNVPLYVGPASKKTSDGTMISKGLPMYESNKVLSINSHENVALLKVNAKEGLKYVLAALNSKQIPAPQILSMDTEGNQIQILAAGPSEVISAIKKAFASDSAIKLNSEELSTVSLTCTGSTSPEILARALEVLEQNKVDVYKAINGAMTISLLIPANHRKNAIQNLHQLIG